MRTLNHEQVKKMLDRQDDVLLVNVLPRDSFEAAHIPGSVNIPLEEGEFIERVMEEAGSVDKRIICYCANNDCTASTEAAQKLDNAGFKAVFDYKGGLKHWREAHYPLEGRMSQAA